MNVLVFGSNIEQLRSITDLIAPDVALLRDPNAWAGEIEQCDAVMFLDEETRQDLLEAYEGVNVLQPPAVKNQTRKKSKNADKQAQSAEDQAGEVKDIE